MFGDLVSFNIGDPRRNGMQSQALDHRLRFDPVTRQFIGGTIVNRWGDGTIKELHWEAIPGMTAFLRCGMYPSAQGYGTPETNHHHGMDVGELVEGETYDVTDPKIYAKIVGFEDHLCRVTCDGETTIGIFECYNPVLHEMCERGVPGFAFAEG